MKKLWIALTLATSVAWGQKLPTLPTTASLLPLDTRAVISRDQGLLAISTQKVTQYEGTQTPAWSLNFPSLKTITAFDLKDTVLVALGITSNQDRVILTHELKNNGKELGNWSLGQQDIQDVVLLSNNNIVTMADSAGVLLLSAFTSQGKTLWTKSLGTFVEWSTRSNLVALPNGNVCISAGGNVWALDPNGKILWTFNSGRDDTNWNQMKLLQNGHLLLVGEGSAKAFNPENIDGRLMEVDASNGEQLWLKILGEASTRESAIDALEQPDGSILVLLETPNGTVLVSQNTQQEARRIAYFESPFPNLPLVKYRQIVSLGMQEWAVLGQATSSNKGLRQSQFFLQSWGIVNPSSPAIYKPNLHLISIGVSTPTLKFTSQDAIAIGNTLQTLKSDVFGEVYVETLVSASSTTATQISSSVERLASLDSRYRTDWYVVFISGFPINYQGDFHIAGSDYDPASPRSTSVSLKSILQDLEPLPGQKLVVLDMCNIRDGRPFFPLDYPTTSVMLGAGEDGTVAFELPALNHGIYTKALLEWFSLPKSNVNDKMNLNEMYDYLVKAVPNLGQTHGHFLQKPMWLLRGRSKVSAVTR